MVGAASTYLYESSWALCGAGAGRRDDKPLRAHRAPRGQQRDARQPPGRRHAARGGRDLRDHGVEPAIRHLRDIHTASAHVMIGTMTFEAAGRALMGIDAAFPFF